MFLNERKNNSSLADRVAKLEKDLATTRELIQSDMKKLIEIINKKGK